MAIAERAVREGMCVVLADAYPASLNGIAARLRRSGAEVVDVSTAMTNAESVTELARRTINEFGAVHLLLNPGAPQFMSATSFWVLSFGRTFTRTRSSAS